MKTYYHGLTVPERVQKRMALSCNNAFCHDIDCTDCIMFSGDNNDLVADYLREVALRDEYIQEGIERILYDRDDEGC